MISTPAPHRVARGAAIDWTDAELDELSEIHVTEDTPLMLAFVRQYAPPRLTAIVTAQAQDGVGDAADEAAPGIPSD